MSTVTVAIPVLNGARYLDEVLAAVRAQRVDRDVEILIVDSGSTDGSLEIARRHGAVVHEIDKSEFSHGCTRNWMMGAARGDHVAFLTQDATPAHDRWLAALLEGFEQADDVAAVFGPHDARPDASHMIKSEMERHFAGWGDGGTRIDVQRLDPSPEGREAYREFPGQLTFLSDVNCAIARWAWERVPYREVPYAEDQLLGRELIEAGFAKVFHPEARVLHSHDYPSLAFFRRYFDEFRSLREVLGFRQPWGPRQTLRDMRGLVGADRRWLRAQGVHGRALVKPLLVSGRHHAGRMAGSIIGTRADRLPAAVRRRLSLEGRETFAPHDVPGSLLERGETNVDGEWEWEFVRSAYPRRPLAGEPLSGVANGPFTIAWVVPSWSVGSGGHTTIFRLIREMERRGHRCSIHLFDPDGREPRSGGQLRELSGRPNAQVLEREGRRDGEVRAEGDHAEPRPAREGRGEPGQRQLDTAPASLAARVHDDQLGLPLLLARELVYGRVGAALEVVRLEAPLVAQDVRHPRRGRDAAVAHAVALLGPDRLRGRRVELGLVVLDQVDLLAAAGEVPERKRGAPLRGDGDVGATEAAQAAEPRGLDFDEVAPDLLAELAS